MEWTTEHEHRVELSARNTEPAAQAGSQWTVQGLQNLVLLADGGGGAGGSGGQCLLMSRTDEVSSDLIDRTQRAPRRHTQLQAHSAAQETAVRGYAIAADRRGDPYVRREAG